MPEFSAQDERWMQQALALAERGLYTTHPNPRVGCVVVRDGQLLGAGWHRRAGEAHAEVTALAQASERARGADVFVTLEPCAHYGRTPPCTEALIKAGVKRVVAAVRDPFAAVDGRGFKVLAAAGITVQWGLLAEQSEALNVGFLRRARHGHPWVRLKMALSLDARTAMATGESQWITGPQARQDGHHFRARSDVVLTSIGTVLSDNPQLTARGVAALERQPARVILDRTARTPADSRILQSAGDVLIFHHSGRPPAAAQAILTPLNQGRLDLNFVFAELARREFNEVLVECGAQLADALISAKRVDELLVYMAPCLLGHAAKPLAELAHIQSLAQRERFEFKAVERLGDDLRLQLQRPGTSL